MIVMVFEFNVAPDEYESYLKESTDLRQHLAEIEGFISVERFESQTTPDRFVAIGYFENEDAVAHWRNLPAHRRAQALGRSRFFISYRLVMAQALRGYTHDLRDAAHSTSAISTAAVRSRSSWPTRKRRRMPSLRSTMPARWASEPFVEPRSGFLHRPPR
jgi:heme-degrading monooxygenase HmoA